MKHLGALSIRLKLLLMLLGVGLGAILVVGTLGYASGRSTLRGQVLAQLTSLRSAKAYQIERYFRSIEEETRSVAQSLVVRQAIDGMKPGFDQLQEEPVSQECVDALRTWYSSEFLPGLGLEASDLGRYLPQTRAGQTLQCRYIAQNPHPTDERALYDDAGDGTAWSEAHAALHPTMRRMSERLVYYDFFLIDAETGLVFYSTSKEADFGTSLVKGPYSTSNLAEVFLRARDLHVGEVAKVDFAAYPPSHLRPAAFVASPVFDGQELVAVFAAQVAIDEIEEIMSGGQNWEADGLGKTGETYLVGPDLKLRSGLRGQLEAPEAYLKELRTLGVDESTLAQIEARGSAILLQTVDTDATRKAQQSASGTEITQDHRGAPVLASFAPLAIDELHWSIHSEIDLAEADFPTRVFASQLLASASALTLLIVLLAVPLADRFVRPILALITATRVVGSGEWDVAVRVYRKDEIGELGVAFNNLIAALGENSRTIRAQHQENSRLLDFIRKTFGQYVSEDVAKALLESPDRVALGGETRDVTVLLSDLRGYSTLSEHLSPEQVVLFLNEYLGGMNTIIDKHKGVVIEYLGDGILACFGAPNDMPGHAEAATRCALEMRERLRQLNEEWAEEGLAALWQDQGIPEIVQRVGLHCGPVVAGNLGSKTRMKYAITGDTVNVAARLEAANKDLGTTILFTVDLYERLPEDLQQGATDHGDHLVKGREEPVHVYSF